MKSLKKTNKKGKFVNLNDFTVTKNVPNHFSSKPIKTHQEYETPLQTLQREFPNFSSDIIESVFEENNRTLITSRRFLDDMCREDDPNPDVSQEQRQISDSNIDNELDPEFESEEKYFDINKFTRFKYEGEFNEDPFLDDSDKTKDPTTNLKDLKRKKYYIDVNTVLSQQKKNSDDYVSVFNSLANEHTPTHKTPARYEEFYLEDLTLDYYCNILLEFFPKFTRMEIMNKICDYNFDIDKLVLSLFDEKNDNMLNDEFFKLEVSEISIEIKEEVLSNFYSGDVVQNVMGQLSQMEEVLFTHNLQGKIEKEIKKNNVTSKLNVHYNETDFPHLSADSKYDIIKSNTISDEYFLEKDIKDIKTKSIREDLIKLGKSFIFTDEFELKWVYYQYMDYNETFKYFKSKSKKKGIFDLLNNGSKYSTNVKHTNSKLIKSSNEGFIVENNNSYENSSLPGILCKIISENPSQWKIENNFKKININDYQTIRKKLIWQAQLAWRSGRHQDAKVIMAKARRYKQEINSLLTDRKIELFVKNNENNSVMNFVSNKENFVDLHGLNYEESKIVVQKKISDIKRGLNNGSIDQTKKFILNIITGVGNHSRDHKAVLMPRLYAMLKSMNYFVKMDSEKGIVKVYI